MSIQSKFKWISLRKTVCVSLPVTLIATLLFSACEKKVKLETDTQKASYAIGKQIATNMKQQNIEVDVDALAASMKDVFAGKESLLKPEELQAAMMKMQENAMKKQQEASDDNKKKGEEFLAQNKTKPGVQTTASGLQYIVEQEGTGAKPTKSDTVKCHYVGTLINGEKFDSSKDRNEPAEFPVSGVIPGWTEALQMMKVGAKYKLFVPPDLAYGPAGRPGIPPNSVLVFEVELLEIVKPKK